MKKLLLMVLVSISCLSLWAQPKLTIVSPVGLDEPPYEVATGTEITFRWSNMEQAPTSYFTYQDVPNIADATYQLDPAWTKSANFIDNGDGTYDFKVTINQPLYVWAGELSSFLKMWTFSAVLKIEIASGVKITAADGWLCPTPGNTEHLQVAQTYARYQWYLDGQPIDNATGATYDATEPGQYKVEVPLNGNLVFSNSLRISEAAVGLTGAFTFTGNKLTMTAAAGRTNYQWLSGPSAGALSPIGAATAASYVATVNATNTFYAVRAQQGGCTVQSEVRVASTAVFKRPVLTSNELEQQNEFGLVCQGTAVTMTASAGFPVYTWYRGGNLWYEWPNNTIQVTEDDSYAVAVPAAGWPEVLLKSADVGVSFYAPERPQLFGVVEYSFHCPGEELTVTLSDPGGIDYTWTKRVVPGEAEEVAPVNGSYTFSFEGETSIVVTASKLGCQQASELHLQSYGAQQFGLMTTSTNEFLCGTMDLQPETPLTDTHDNFQWYTLKDDGTYTLMTGKTAQKLIVTAPGTYVLRARLKACGDNVIVESYPYRVSDASSQTFVIEGDKTELCEGEKATLTIDIQDIAWSNIQWFEKAVTNSSSGHKEIYIPVAAMGTSNTAQAGKFTTYQARANHPACPTGVKAISQTISIRPKVNPDITSDPPTDVYRYVIGTYEPIASLIFCGNEETTFKVPTGYTSYQWYKGGYDGGGNYQLGTPVAGATTNEHSFFPDVAWLTVRVEDTDGCVGYSHPLLIDSWAHQAPAVSYTNSELCEEGDSVRLNSAFLADWVRYEWYNNGVLMENSDNDTIYVKEPGGYYIKGYPVACPTIGYSSGIPVRVRYMPTPFVIENDTLYAVDVEGYGGEPYAFSWTVDGEAFDADGQPFVLKSALTTGSHTLQAEIVNMADCSRISDPYTSTITGLEPGEGGAQVRAFPNPTRGTFMLYGVHSAEVYAIKLYNAQGIPVKNAVALPADGAFDLSTSPAGVYIVEVVRKDGSSVKIRVARQ